MKRMPIRVHIRWMIRRDMPEVLAIEHASFEHPWCEEDLLRVLRQRNAIGMVAERGELVAGFMIYELHKNKLNILDFAVHPEYRHQTVGRQMMDKLVGKLSSHRRTSIVTQVREMNLSGQLFLRREKWQATTVLRKHYSDTGEDAFLMHYLYDESSLS
jgi:ribosomal-protein-alanine N-acetyltransferase